MHIMQNANLIIFSAFTMMKEACSVLAEVAKREDAAAIGMAAAFGTAFKAATKGEEAITEADKEKLKEGINAMNDAATGGMAVYTRRADDAEAKIK